MLNTKKQQKKIVEAFKKDTAAVKDFLQQLKSDHVQTFSEEENKALDAIDRYFTNLDTWFSGFANGLRG